MAVRVPALPAAERARLCDRRVWRDGERERESIPELTRYLERCGSRLAFSLELAEPLFTPQGGGPVLELGAEPWLFTQLLLERGHSVTAAGLRPGEGNGRAEVTIEWDGRSASVDQHRFDVERDPWPFPDESFEAVLCMEVIEHLSFSPAHMLYEANRVLVPGGHLLLTTPNALAAYKLAAMLSGRTVHHPYSGYEAQGRHNREFTPRELRMVLEHANFAVALRSENLAGYEPAASLGRALSGLTALPGRRAARRRDHLFAVARKAGPPRLAFPPELYRAIDRDRMRRSGVRFADEPSLTP